ncbi:hypothetical protein Hanom_Chr14g01283371 [Helianthus anomalus]
MIFFNREPVLTRYPPLIENRFVYCAKHDPEVNGETEKNFADLLSEELRSREAEALESQQRADMALLEAKKLTSQYQKEAGKCKSGMETCEEAREKAEAALIAQKRQSELWQSSYICFYGLDLIIKFKVTDQWCHPTLIF